MTENKKYGFIPKIKADTLNCEETGFRFQESLKGILFCDDDPNFLQILSDMVKVELEKLKVEAELLPYYSGQQLLKQIEFMPVDAIFLDIDMPEMSGFDIAAIVEKLSLQPILIFVSNLDHLVYESFTYNPFWFLRKSHLEPLPLLINKLVEQVRLLKQTFSFEANGEKYRFF